MVRMRLAPLVVCIVLSAAWCTGCRGSSAPAPSSAATGTTTAGGPGTPGVHVVRVANFAFSPDTVTIHVGETVLWEFHQASAPHNVVSLDAPVPFNSGVPQGSGTFRFTFTVPGTYTYDCQIHPSMMGTVIVSS